MASLAASFGRGAMTNHWVDFKNSDVHLVIGANPAENHPCGWKWAHVARDERGAKIIHVDPRFTRTSAIADIYAPIRAGTDVAFFGGLINYILVNDLHHEEYVRLHTNASFLVDDNFTFEDGMFSGYDPQTRSYDVTTWDYQREEGSAVPGVSPVARQGFARRDMTLRDPRTVFQLMRRHYARYTPEMVSAVTGMPVEKFIEIADTFGATGVPEKVGSIVYAVGLTHHTSGVQIIRGLGMVQLLLGNMGRPGGGVNAERGHANIQGNTDNAISWEILPGYLAIPRPGMETMSDYLQRVPTARLTPESVNFFGANYRRFLVSLLKAWFGDASTSENDWGYAWIPKPAGNASWLTIHDNARRGTIRGILASGMSGVNIGPDSHRILASLGNLKWLVAMDPLLTATATFWKSPGVHPERIDTEVFFFPTTHWIEKDGSFVNSGRWMQWKYKALDAPGEVKDDNWIVGQLRLRLKKLYEQEGGPLPEPILNLTWSYTNPENPALDEIAREINGRDLVTGLRLDTFAQLKDDGTTTAGNWLYTGSHTEEGNLAQRRGREDPTGLGHYHNWAWSWPLNRRILYNRASADAEGRPWDPTRPGIVWNGSRWVGDVPDFAATSPPRERTGAFIMTGEGVGRLFAPGGLLGDGPFPEHYEQAESPVANLLSGTDKHPTVFLYEGARETFAPSGSQDFPYVATTYRVTEHEHFVTQYVPYLVEAMPDFFVELDPELARQKGITNGGRVRVRSMRGEVEGVAIVTKRMRPLRLGG
ncbi:MAG: formate dehydrogenase-N subunit alpha, partial [Egibacteraceae bacterium]